MAFSPKTGLRAFGDQHIMLSNAVENKDWGATTLDKIPC